MPKKYNPLEVEERLENTWYKAGAFERSEGVGDCTVTIPPPNITGALHMGHALNNTIQDTIIRKNRMAGMSTRWIVGTDHAGIATQTKVDQALKAKGIDRHEIGREKFLEYCQKWREKYGSKIIEQNKRIGCSADFSDEHFTMDDDYAKAVRKTFVDWYNDGLIYHGERIVNWCPDCVTAIADDEVEYEDEHGHLWYINYPLTKPVDGIEHLTVATTRPETMLGDTGVAVNPKDERFKNLVGSTVVLPLVNREIPVFADHYVDSSFGTGCVKVTPAHDINDWQMGQRNNLDIVNIFDENAVVTQEGGKYKGLTREEAREAVLKDLEAGGYLDHVEDLDHSVGHCYRCHNALEPWLSDQWFVDVDKLKEPATRVVKNGEVTFYPSRWEDTYITWMENLRDWCISRQLWWGHRIPVFYCDACGFETASMDDLTTCPKCGGALRQDPDVLDTWFSSQLWTFATQGWPDSFDELKKHHPTMFLSTAPDIIALWVARMVMASMYFLDEIPFHDVLIHPTVLAADGSRMSKSKGNGIDPIDLINGYGADAMRFCLLLQVTGGQAIKFNEKETMPPARAFVTKIWNASRFVISNLDDFEGDVAPKVTHAEDAWILSRLANLAEAVTLHIDDFKLGDMSRELYAFFWNEFCDWYIELAKPRLNAGGSERRDAQQNLVFVLDTALHLLHPAMPFVTEEIWSYLPKKADAKEFLMLDAWPNAEDLKSFKDPEAEKSFTHLIDIASAVRSTRARYGISPKEPLSVEVHSDASNIESIASEIRSIKELVNLDELTLKDDASKPGASTLVVTDVLEIYILLEGKIDLDAERSKLQKEIDKTTKDLAKFEKKLSNSGFLNNAKQEVIDKTKATARELASQVERLKKQYEALS